MTRADEPTSGVEARNIVAKLLHGRGLTAGHIETYDAADAIIASLRQPPPASPSPAPAAVDVEDLVARLREVRYLNLTSIDPITKSQLDTVGKLMGEAATALSTLAADKARIEAERDRALSREENCERIINQIVEERGAAEARASALEEALVKIERLGSDGEHSGDRHAQCRAIAQSALAASRKETP